VREAVVSQQPATFVDFYQASRDGCLRAVMVSTGDRQLAEELVAEAFARAWASWPKVSRHPAPAAWVVRTALNTGISWWRKRRREFPLDGHDAPAPAEVEGVDADVMNAVRRLPARQREVVALRIFLDLDTETTARALGIAPGTVTAHMSRAITALRRELAPSDVERELSFTTGFPTTKEKRLRNE
jgi:RNA polymerase sigma-70 factor (sigma-E family)